MKFFYEWASVSELDYEILNDLGVNSEIDRRQILACVRAAEDVKSRGPQIENLEFYENNEELIKVENSASNENTYEYYEQEADFGAYLTKEPKTNERPEEEDEIEQTLGIALKIRFGHLKNTDLTKKQIEKASYQKCGKYQDFDQFLLGINSLFLTNKGYTTLVKFF